MVRATTRRMTSFFISLFVFGAEEKAQNQGKEGADDSLADEGLGDLGAGGEGILINLANLHIIILPSFEKKLRSSAKHAYAFRRR